MKIKESAEMYLETILILCKQNNEVRSVDIANELKYSKASVSVAMKKLQKNNLVEMNKNGFISLTLSGKETAEKIYERHIFLTQWLKACGVAEEIAEKDACKIEHVISQESFQGIKKFVENKEKKSEELSLSIEKS